MFPHPRDPLMMPVPRRGPQVRLFDLRVDAARTVRRGDTSNIVFDLRSRTPIPPSPPTDRANASGCTAFGKHLTDQQ